ncbi:MAG: M48 family metallopeptidase [Pyrinomonadaceae bacterium]
MTTRKFQKQLISFGLLAAMVALPITATAQTRVSIPKNKYKVGQDVELGRKTAVQVEQQLPILNDDLATHYVSRVGERLVANIPPQFRQPAFDYSFKVVNASDINAFALPGGPMYVNRGMIEAAKNEGEMAGVMAHEISHVALRHATAQATKQSSAGSVLGQLGLILGGAILAGQTGAQAGALAAAAWQTKYSRAYESDADILGARIMADAGYDPRDLANMFRTIEAQSEGSRAPEWLSSHPDPGNRYQKINQEAARLNVSREPIKSTREFERVQASLGRLAPARTMAQIEKDRQGQGTSTSAMTGGRYSNSVSLPSRQSRTYTGGSLFRVDVPTNWREFPAQSDVTFSPEGAYGSQGITHGLMMGVFQPQDSNLRNATQSFVSGLLQTNSYLRQRNSISNEYLDSKQGYTAMLFGRSPVTVRNEVVNIYTAQLRNGYVFYAITVVPESEEFRYRNTFREVINSVNLN